MPCVNEPIVRFHHRQRYWRASDVFLFDFFEQSHIRVLSELPVHIVQENRVK